MPEGLGVLGVADIVELAVDQDQREDDQRGDQTDS